VLGGFAIAILAAAQVSWFKRLPLNAVVFCLAGIAGALVARGTAYPGRFSIHLIPVTVTMAVCASALLVRRTRYAPSVQISATSSPTARHDVRPGESIPDA